MSGASDKARFHIERTVPDLREWERRELFSKPEITSITSRRTTFETQLNSREATPSLYIRYVTYESNASLLLSKRLSRLSIPPKAAQKLRISQQGRIFAILDRATRKFHGDLNLWAQYLHYCRNNSATRRGQRVLTECLRLFPTRPEVWGYAAGWAEGSGDLGAARGYYLRGIRFCGDKNKGGRDLYLRFARAEMRWVGERRKILNLKDGDHSQTRHLKAENADTDAQREEEEQANADMIAIPSASQEEDPAENPDAFHHFSSTPAMTGAIPIAIFDQAMKAYHNDESVAEAFFDMFAQFQNLPCTARILNHVVKVMGENEQHAMTAESCHCRLPLIGVSVDSPDYPAAVRLSLSRIKSCLQPINDEKDKATLSQKLLTWVRPLSEEQRLVPELKTVLKTVSRQLERNTIGVVKSG